MNKRKNEVLVVYCFPNYKVLDNNYNREIMNFVWWTRTRYENE